jgi:hypothetical protein
MRGCLTGCFVLFAAVVILAIIGALSGRPTQQHHMASRPGHGWVVAPSKFKLDENDTARDFWDDLASSCAALHAAANEVYNATNEGRAVDTSVADNAPGRHNIEPGTHVEVLGHVSGSCHGVASTPYTKVRVIDGSSPLNGRAGYLVEGMLARQ